MSRQVLLLAGLVLLVSQIFSPFTTQAFSEPIKVGVTNLMKGTDKVREIQQVLESTGLDVEFISLPNERSLRMLVNGLIDIDLYRQPNVIAGYSNVIQILPKVASREFWLVARTIELCSLPEKQKSTYRVVGIRGARIFPNRIYPKFRVHYQVDNFDKVLSSLNQDRADFSVWSLGSIKRSAQSTGIAAIVCPQSPYFTINFYSYVHKDLSWAVPKIERAYHQAFQIETN